MKNGHGLDEHGFTLIEAMIAGVIFTIAVTGVFASISSMKKPVGDTNNSLAAAYCGQQVLERLRAAVDNNDWSAGSSELSIGNHTLSGAGLAGYSNCSGISSVGYTVSDSGNGVRKVDLTVTY